jgi:hypothetical protein
MWKYLSQDHNFLTSDQDELSTDRLKLFIMIILKVAEAKVLQEYLTNQEHGFNFEVAPSLVRAFEQFYLNRLQYLAKLQVQKKSDMENLQTAGLSFRPHLSETTI